MNNFGTSSDNSDYSNHRPDRSSNFTQVEIDEARERFTQISQVYTNREKIAYSYAYLCRALTVIKDLYECQSNADLFNLVDKDIPGVKDRVTQYYFTSLTREECNSSLLEIWNRLIPIEFFQAFNKKVEAKEANKEEDLRCQMRFEPV